MLAATTVSSVATQKRCLMHKAREPQPVRIALNGAAVAEIENNAVGGLRSHARMIGSVISTKAFFTTPAVAMMLMCCAFPIKQF